MRIGIDARFYGPTGKGLGRYTQKLIQNLEVIDQHNDYVVFLRAENWDSYQPTNRRWKKVLADFQWYSLQEQVMFPRTLHAAGCDLVHFPHFNVPVFFRGAFVVTVHDLILTHFPTLRATTLGPLMYAWKHLAYTMVIRRAVRRARRVITVSEYSKHDIASHFKLPASKIIVTPEAVDIPSRGISRDTLEHYLTHIGLRRPFVLYVGNAYPHKNLERCVEAFADVRRRHPDLTLVMTGREDYFFKRLKVVIRNLGSADAVKFPGFVTDEQLYGLYQAADAFIFPSLYEGFGLPPLEAMAAGTPVVASKATSIPEVLGDAAVYFDPTDIRDMIQALERVLTDTKLRQDMRERGAHQVARYSWRQLAEHTLAAYTSTSSDV